MGSCIDEVLSRPSVGRGGTRITGANGGESAPTWWAARRRAYERRRDHAATRRPREHPHLLGGGSRARPRAPTSVIAARSARWRGGHPHGEERIPRNNLPSSTAVSQRRTVRHAPGPRRSRRRSVSRPRSRRRAACHRRRARDRSRRALKCRRATTSRGTTRHHGPAGATEISPRSDRPRAWRSAMRWRPAKLPLANAVTDDAERPSWNPARGTASRTTRRPRPYRPTARGLDPKVDVQRRMNDEIRAPSFHGSGARREGARCPNETLASPFLWADEGVDAPPPLRPV